MGSPLRPKVEYDGQRYLDEPITKVMRQRRELDTVIAHSLSLAFKTKLPQPIVDVVGHERVLLCWMTGDGQGGIKPRSKKEAQVQEAHSTLKVTKT